MCSELYELKLVQHKIMVLMYEHAELLVQVPEQDLDPTELQMYFHWLVHAIDDAVEVAEDWEAESLPEVSEE